MPFPIGARPLAIVDLELSRGATTPSNQQGRRYVVVRLHGIPLGVVVTSGNEPPARELGPIVDRLITHLARDAAEDPLDHHYGGVGALLAREHPQATRSVPTLTVVVCTQDRTADLSTCLGRLERACPANAELLVVDNAPSSNSTERLVKERFPRVRYVLEPLVGLNRARNKAIVESSSEVIAFTDDDVRVEPTWVSTVQALFARNPEVSLMTGLVLPFEFETEAQWLF